jgi:hypothetical protein
MPRLGFEPTIEWAKTVYALDQVATVFGRTLLIQILNSCLHFCFPSILLFTLLTKIQLAL